MKKTISSSLTLFFRSRYPLKTFKKVDSKNYVVIGIGGNIGNTKRTFDKLFLKLLHNSHFKIIQTSPILQNPPFGYLNQNDFYNAIIVLQTELSSSMALHYFLYYEKCFKRKRSFQDAPRTLDIDIIFFKNRKIDTKNLQVPHPKYKNRQSVLIPLQFVLSDKIS